MAAGRVRHRRVRATAALLAAGLCCATLAGCANSVAGSGQAGFPSGTLGPTLTPSPTPNPIVSLPQSVSLTHRLLPPPAGSRSWVDNWSANVTPTISELVTALYEPSERSLIIRHLQGEGVAGIAHRTWISTNNREADDILLVFNDDGGSNDRYSNEVTGYDNDTSSTTFPVTGVPSDALSTAFYQAKPDAKGFVRSETFIVRGSYVMIMNCFSPSTLDQATVSGWAAAQAKLMTP